MRTFRCTDPLLLHRRLAHLQPRSTPLLGAALAGRAGPGSGLVAHVVHDRGRTLAVLVVRRWSALGWTAHPLVLDPVAAPVVGRLVDRSPATDLMGFAADTMAVQPHVRRWRRETEVTAAAVPPGFTWPAPPPHARLARSGDVDALVSLGWTHAPHSIASRRGLRRRMRAAVANGSVVVLDEPTSGIVGYAARESHTPEYDLWGHIVVDPEHRGQGHSWDLVAAAADRARARGAGGLTLVLPSNPMTIPEPTRISDSFRFVWLAPPRRFKGERRLREAAGSWGRRPARGASGVVAALVEVSGLGPEEGQVGRDVQPRLDGGC